METPSPDRAGASASDTDAGPLSVAAEVPGATNDLTDPLSLSPPPLGLEASDAAESAAAWVQTAPAPLSPILEEATDGPRGGFGPQESGGATVQRSASPTDEEDMGGFADGELEAGAFGSTIRESSAVEDLGFGAPTGGSGRGSVSTGFCEGLGGSIEGVPAVSGRTTS